MMALLLCNSKPFAIWNRSGTVTISFTQLDLPEYDGRENALPV